MHQHGSVYEECSQATCYNATLQENAWNHQGPFFHVPLPSEESDEGDPKSDEQTDQCRTAPRILLSIELKG